MTWLALPWFVLVTSGSATRMSAVVGAELIGLALLGIPGGAVLRRLGAWRTMLLSDAIRAPLMLAIPLLHWAGIDSFVPILALAFLLGALAGPYFAAQKVIVPELLGEDEALVGRANALFQGATRITMLLGPVLGGILIATVSAPWALVADAATYVVSAVILLTLVPRPAPLPRTDEDVGARRGLRFLGREPLLRLWIPLFALGDTAWTAFFVSVPVLVVTRFDADPRVAGWLLASFGVGAVAGNAVAYKFLLERVGGLKLVGTCILGQALPLWLLTIEPSAWLAAGALGLSGLANGLVNPSIHSLHDPARAAAAAAERDDGQRDDLRARPAARRLRRRPGARRLRPAAGARRVRRRPDGRDDPCRRLELRRATPREHHRGALDGERVSVLRARGLGALLASQVVSSLGSQMTFLALPWFVLATTGSPTRMSIVLAAELAPVAVLGIPSGVVIARWGARRTMLVADLARVPVIASIPLLHELGLLSFPLLLVLVALVGVFIAPYFASQALILPELVGDDEQVVAQANALVEGARRATSLLGPAAAGILIATFSAPVVLYVDAATFLLSFALLLLFVPHRPPLAAERRRQGDARGDPLRAAGSDASRAQRHCPLRERLRADARRRSHGARLRGVLQLAGRRRVLRGVRHRCRARQPRRREARRALRAAAPRSDGVRRAHPAGLRARVRAPRPRDRPRARALLVLRASRERTAGGRDHDALAGGDPREGHDRGHHGGDARRARRDADRGSAPRELGRAARLPARRLSASSSP